MPVTWSFVPSAAQQVSVQSRSVAGTHTWTNASTRSRSSCAVLRAMRSAATPAGRVEVVGLRGGVERVAHRRELRGQSLDLTVEARGRRTGTGTRQRPARDGRRGSSTRRWRTARRRCWVVEGQHTFDVGVGERDGPDLVARRGLTELRSHVVEVHCDRQLVDGAGHTAGAGAECRGSQREGGQQHVDRQRRVELELLVELGELRAPGSGRARRRPPGRSWARSVRFARTPSSKRLNGLVSRSAGAELERPHAPLRIRLAGHHQHGTPRSPPMPSSPRIDIPSPSGRPRSRITRSGPVASTLVCLSRRPREPDVGESTPGERLLDEVRLYRSSSTTSTRGPAGHRRSSRAVGLVQCTSLARRHTLRHRCR